MINIELAVITLTIATFSSATEGPYACAKIVEMQFWLYHITTL